MHLEYILINLIDISFCFHNQEVNFPHLEITSFLKKLGTIGDKNILFEMWDIVKWQIIVEIHTEKEDSS